MRVYRWMGASLVLSLLLSFSATAAEDRPRWSFPEDEARLRETLRDWVSLDVARAAVRAQRMAVDAPRDLPRAAEDLVALARASGDERFGRIAVVVLDAVLSPRVEALGGDPAAAITTRGSADAVNLEVRDLSFLFAMRHAAGDGVDDATQVRRILLRFAEVIPSWPLWDRAGEARAQTDRSFHRQWDGRGIWGVWHHMDLERSYPLLRAYDLVYGTLSPEERDRIREGIFHHHKQLIDRWTVYFSNMLGHRLMGMAQFGLVLPEPAFIHEVRDIYHRMVFAGFFPDGFYREVSPSYHTMPVQRMTGRISDLLRGYSDPPGYRHPETGRRIDDLDLSAQYTRHHERWWTAWDKLTLPNGKTLAVNDATAGRGAWWTRHPPPTAPRLLGASGIAMLGAGTETAPHQVYLLFADTHGHEHRDALHFVWFAHGREVFSETDYRPLPDSGSSREWQASTAGHNTIVIDETNQHGRFSGYRRTPTEDDGMLDMPRAWRSRQLAMNHGNLLLFDPGWPEVQAVEAESERSYAPTASLYRRTLALVDLGRGNGYLVDIFRVRGGMTHDYMLHGCLDEPYTLNASLPMGAVEDLRHTHLRVHSRSPARPPFTLSFGYADGLRVLSHVLAPFERDGTGLPGVELSIGSAPAMRRMGDAEFASLRRMGGSEIAAPGGANAFILLHETVGEGPSAIVSAEVLPVVSDDPEAVAVRVVLADGRADLFLSTLGEGSMALEDGTRFQGRLAYLRREEGRVTAARVMDGHRLTADQGAVRIEGIPSLQGRVLATRRVENGDAEEALVVDDLPEGTGDLAGRTIFVTLDDATDFVWAYRIEGVDRGEEGTTVIRIEHDPGFEIREDGALTKLVYHPGWGFRSPARYRIGGTGHWEATASP